MQLNYLIPNYESENSETKEEQSVTRKWPTYWCNIGLHHNKVHVHVFYILRVSDTSALTHKNTQSVKTNKLFYSNLS